MCSKPLAYVLLDAGSDVAFLSSLVELLACDVLVQLDVAVRYALCILVSNLWHSLTRLVHEVVLDEPLANELLGKLALRLTLLKLLLVTISVEVAARVWSMDLVDEVNLTVALTELVLGIYEDQSLLGSDFLTTGEDAACIVLHYSVILCTNNTLGDDLFLRDVHIVTLVSLCSRGDDRLWETLVLAHSVRQLHTADLAASLLIVTPCTTGEDRTDDHLHAETFALQTYCNHWVWSSQLPVWTDICSCVQELSCNLIEHLTLEWNTLWQNNIEC